MNLDDAYKFVRARYEHWASDAGPSAQHCVMTFGREPDRVIRIPAPDLRYTLERLADCYARNQAASFGSFEAVLVMLLAAAGGYMDRDLVYPIFGHDVPLRTQE